MSLPVVIKGGRHLEKTLTANVSAHGVAVFSERELPLRQYVELELTLPNGNKINATAMVVRNEPALSDRAGLTHPGIAFDFYLLDAIGRASWWAYVAQLGGGVSPPAPVDYGDRMPGLESAHETLGYSKDRDADPLGIDLPHPSDSEARGRAVSVEPQRLPSDAMRPLSGGGKARTAKGRPPSFGAPTVSAAPNQPKHDSSDDGTATFIVNPRDQGRLWAFFRGELAQGRVKIESPVVRPVGTPVELLVVHPKTEAEWSLWGEVFAVHPRGRGNDPMLEIRMGRQDQQAVERFRRFIATGHAPQGDDMPPDADDMPRDSEENPIKAVPRLMPDDPDQATTEAPMVDEVTPLEPQPSIQSPPKKRQTASGKGDAARRSTTQKETDPEARRRAATFAAFFDEFDPKAQPPPATPPPAVVPKARLDDEEETSPAEESEDLSRPPPLPTRR